MTLGDLVVLAGLALLVEDEEPDAEDDDRDDHDAGDHDAGDGAR